MKRYWTMITPDYLSHWSVTNAVREYISNALDSPAPFEYEIGEDYVILTSKGITLSPTIFAMGYSQNRKDSSAVGQFGEGALVSMVPIKRENKTLEIFNGNVVWTPAFELNEDLGVEVLVIRELPLVEGTNDYSVKISGLTSDEIEEITNNCIYFRKDLGEVLEGSTGSIIKGFKGKLFVGGIFVTEIGSSYEYSFNFKPEHLPLNRDRKSVESFDLVKQTSILIKELIDPVEIAKLVEQRKPEVANLHYRTELLPIAEACYDNLVEKYGDDVVICQWYDDQNKLEKQGYKNVVNVSHGNYYDILVQSPRYKKKLAELTSQLPQEEVEEKTPLELLEEVFTTSKHYTYQLEDFEKLLDIFRERGLKYEREAKKATKSEFDDVTF